MPKSRFMVPVKSNVPATTEPNLDALFSEIALRHLFIDTLETRGRDSLDFHDVSVSGIKRALRAAYEAGKASK